MIRVFHPISRIRMLAFYPSQIPDPEVKKAPDPGSAALHVGNKIKSSRIQNTAKAHIQ
jgi:hypothetical protein